MLNDDQFFCCSSGWLRTIFSSYHSILCVWVSECVCTTAFLRRFIWNSLNAHISLLHHMKIVPKCTRKLSCTYFCCVMQPGRLISSQTRRCRREQERERERRWNWVSKKWRRDKGEHKSSQIIISQPFASYDLCYVRQFFVHSLTFFHILFASSREKKMKRTNV